MQIVSITSQGQLTIPKKMWKELGIKAGVKAEITKKGETFVVKPMKSFWDLGGSLFNGIRLSDTELRKARDSFEKDWADRV
jgi:AbrB family looped-hinge helix DNA binding protein